MINPTESQENKLFSCPHCGDLHPCVIRGSIHDPKVVQQPKTERKLSEKQLKILMIRWIISIRLPVLEEYLWKLVKLIIASYERGELFESNKD